MSEELNPTNTTESEETNEAATPEATTSEETTAEENTTAATASAVETEASDPAAPAEDSTPKTGAPDANSTDASSSETTPAVPTPTAVSGPQEFSGEYQGGRSRRIGNDVRFDDINYKNINLLVRFLDQRGRILSRRKTRVNAKVQRRIVKAVKIARHLALLPFTADQTRIVRKRR